jgi:alpha-L-rhamnosidase
MYGNIVVNWERNDKTASYSIEVPVNCSAKVYIPAVDKKHVKEGKILAENATGITYIGSEQSDAVGNYIIYEVGAGIYHFKVDKLPKTDFPNPIYNGNNLSLIGRMSTSSMHIKTEKLPGFEAFKANDENLETAWKANGSNDEWIEVAWVKPQTFDKVLIKETGDNIRNHKIQYWDGKAWVDIAKGTSCGSDKTYTFKAVTASKCRLYVEEATNSPIISEFQIIKHEF